MTELNQEQKDRLVNLTLTYTKELREITRHMTTKEKIFFLSCLKTGIETVENKFREQLTKEQQCPTESSTP